MGKGDNNEKYAKLGRGSERGHVTYFTNFGIPYIILETAKTRKFKFGTWMQNANTRDDQQVKSKLKV